MSHVIMKKSLAKALMDAGVEHYGVGGAVGTIGGGIIGGIYGGPPGAAAGAAIGGAGGSLVDTVMGGGGGLDPTNRFDPQDPSIHKQNFMPQITEQQRRQADVYGQQQSLAQALLAQSQGQGGPSAAQAMLNQQTGQNAAMQGALMASQRGASANPALIARMAAQQGAQAQQAALGQAATMRAQEQLAAQNALAQQQAQMANQALQAESIQQGGQAAQNTAITTGQLGTQNIRANAEAQNAATRGGMLGGLLQAGGSMLGGLFHDGGEVKKMAVGGPIQLMDIQRYDAPMNPSPIAMSSPSQGGGGLQAGIAGMAPMIAGMFGGGGGGGMMMAGGPMDAGGITDPSMGSGTMIANSGGFVPGKASTNGDSEKNDVVPALLSPGEVVLPRSVTQSSDPAKKAAEFMAHLKPKKMGYGGIVEARKKMNKGGRC